MESLNLSDYLRPGELGIMRSSGAPGMGYDGAMLDESRSAAAAAVLAHIDRWSDGLEDGLPNALHGRTVIAEVAMGLAIRLFMVKNKLLTERRVPLHNSSVRLKLGRRAAGNDHEAETRKAAITLFNEKIADGKLKKVAYKAVYLKYGIPERTMRNHLKTP